MWRCEFCCSEKEINLVPEEIPSKETATYLITPAPPVTGASANEAADSMIVFCVDVSGSMCVSTEASITNMYLRMYILCVCVHCVCTYVYVHYLYVYTQYCTYMTGYESDQA